MAAAGGTSRAKRAQAKALAESGMSCRAIAVKLGTSRTTVSRWAKEDGFTFDRSQTAAASSARQFDMAAARARLAEKMTLNADRALAAVEKPFLVYSFGGKDNDYNEHTLPEAPISARREAQTIAGIAVDKLTRIVETSDEGAASAKSLLTDLGKALGIVAPE